MFPCTKDVLNTGCPHRGREKTAQANGFAFTNYRLSRGFLFPIVSFFCFKTWFPLIFTVLLLFHGRSPFYCASERVDQSGCCDAEATCTTHPI